MFSFPTFLKLSKSILIRDSHEQRASHPEARARLSELQAMYAQLMFISQKRMKNNFRSSALCSSFFVLYPISKVNQVPIPILAMYSSDLGIFFKIAFVLLYSFENKKVGVKSEENKIFIKSLLSIVNNFH